MEVVTLNYINDENKYTLSRSEFAKKIGKSIGAVKQDMRRGKYKDLYIFKNGKYFFRLEEEMRTNYGGTQVPKYPLNSKKQPNRGNHFNAGYPNEAFKKHNELKMLMKIKEQISDPEATEFLNDYKSWKQEKTKKRQKEVQNTLRSTVKNYGGPIRSPGFVTWSTPWKPLETPKKDEYDRYLEDHQSEAVDWSKKYY